MWLNSIHTWSVFPDLEIRLVILCETVKNQTHCLQVINALTCGGKHLSCAAGYCDNKLKIKKGVSNQTEDKWDYALKPKIVLTARGHVA